MTHVLIDCITNIRYALPDSGEVKIGYGNENFISTPPIFADVKRDHCMLRVNSQGVYVRNLSNGRTSVSGNPIGPEFVQLRSRDMIGVGQSFTLKFMAE